MQRRKVDLPEPEGPSRHITSPRLHLESDPLEDLEAPEALVHPLGLDHRPAHLSRRLPNWSHRDRIDVCSAREKPRPNRRSTKYWPT